MFSGGLDRIVSEFYKKKIYKKVLWAWNDIIYNPKDNIIEDKGYKYWAIKTMLIVFINWTSFIKDSYKLKKLTNSRRNFHCENTGKNSLSNSSSGNIEKKYFKLELMESTLMIWPLIDPSLLTAQNLQQINNRFW